MCGHGETPERVATPTPTPHPRRVPKYALEYSIPKWSPPNIWKNWGEVLCLGVESCLQVEITLLPGLGGS